MATWQHFADAAPEMAAFGYERIFAHGIGLAFLATIRHEDGGPRVHPVCPILAAGRLYVSVATPVKWRDLRADPRYMLHAFPADEDPEFSIRGRTREVADPEEHRAAVDAIPFPAYDPEHPIFELDVERADTTVWERFGTPDQRPIRRRWPGG